MGLQKHWVNVDGKIHRRLGGIVEPKKPRNRKTGSKINAHFFDLGDSPWTHSFEGAFDAVDSSGARAVESALMRIKASPAFKIGRSKLASWLPISANTSDIKVDFIPEEELHALARIAISIVFRSPAFRFRKSFSHPSFFDDKTPNPELGKGNTWHYWSSFYSDKRLPLEPVGTVFLVSSKGHEFVIGDGFHETFSDQLTFSFLGDGRPVRKCSGEIFLPLSPDVCAVIVVNSGFGQRLALLSGEETDQINKITCLNSRNEIYFRNLDRVDFDAHNEPSVRRAEIEDGFFLNSVLKKMKPS